MKKIEINNQSLAYFDNGKGNPTLLFIHGAFINKEYWSEQITHFSPKYRVIAIDLAGHGNSSHNRTEWTIQNYGKDISKFMDKLSLKNVILIGHSIGADIILETVTDNPKPIIGLVGIDYFKNVGVELPEKTIDQLVTSLKTDFVNTCEQYAKQALLTKETNSEHLAASSENYDMLIEAIDNDGGIDIEDLPLITEAMKASKRNALPDSTFGIPEERKYYFDKEGNLRVPP